MSNDDLIRLGFQVDTAQVIAAVSATTNLSKATAGYAIEAASAASAAKRFAASVQIETTYQVQATAATTEATSAAKIHAAAVASMGTATTTTAQAQAMFASELNQVASASNKAAMAAKSQDSYQQTQYSNASAGLGKFIGNAQKTTGGVNALNYRLMVMGQTIDDLQYVGEQGLRPILNNIMMINPALGIFAVAAENVRKHWTEVSNVAQGTFKYWTEGYEKSNSSQGDFSRGLKEIGGLFLSGATSATKFFAEVGEGFDAMAGGPQKRAAATVEAFSERKSEAEKEQGATFKKGVGQFGGKEVIDALMKHQEALSPDFADDQSGKNKDVREAEKARLADLVKSGEGGDKNAQSSVIRMLKGTNIGATIERTMSADADKADLEKYRKEEEEKRLAAERRNDLIDERRQKKGQEVAEAMGHKLGRSIVDNTIDEGDADAHAIGAKSEIAKRLKDTGQVQSDEEARKIAEIAYDQIWGNTWKEIRKRVNANGGTAQEAARKIAQEQDEKDPFIIAEKERRQEEAKRGIVYNANRRDTINTQLGNASGMLDPVTAMLFQARQSSLNFRTTGEARKFSRMSLDQQQEYAQRNNDRDDAQATAIVKRNLLRNRVTDDPAKAEEIAKKMVNEARGRINGVTGDPATLAMEKQTTALEDNTKALLKGVNILMN